MLSPILYFTTLQESIHHRLQFITGISYRYCYDSSLTQANPEGCGGNNWLVNRQVNANAGLCCVHHH